MNSKVQFFKRLFDITISFLVLVLFSPLYLFLGIIIHFYSKVPIIFTQKRIGRNGKPFTIYKFRTMYENAEVNGPKLSSTIDKRITPIGKFMRKHRFDEFPQFYNVLIGDMSIVGPRPERQFYIDKIVEKAPHYSHLTKIRPGITSWGQVKFGYAETVEDMISRLKYDLIYIKNISFLLDMKILFYTIVTVFKGVGK